MLVGWWECVLSRSFFPLIINAKSYLQNRSAKNFLIHMVQVIFHVNILLNIPSCLLSLQSSLDVSYIITEQVLFGL